MRLGYLSILGEPGSYDPSVYDSLPGGDDECDWIRRRFAYLSGVEVLGARVSHGDPVPAPETADAFILGGSYNSVHDDFPWQRALMAWFSGLRAAKKPLLGICGGHQLMARYFGGDVVTVVDGPIAGTLPVSLTAAGRSSLLFGEISERADFHFANYEQVPEAPAGSTVLASTDRLPAAALDYGDRWYSVQYHPEAGANELALSWKPTDSQLAQAYRDTAAGSQLIENFIAVV